MPRRPIIGIPTQTLHSIEGIPEALPESWVMNQRYSRVVAASGGVPVMIPLLDDESSLRALYDLTDGLLIPGGVDLDPATYGESPLPTCGRLDPARDRVELQVARWALAEGSSADRQLATYKRTGDLKAVVDQLIAETEEGVVPGASAEEAVVAR